MPTVKKKNLGFSLVEMAIVLGIVALLMASLLPLLSGQVEQGRRAETKKLLNEIQQALIGYAVANGRLPCPAKATLATGAANAGIEATTGNNCACVNNSGSTVADNSALGCTGTTVAVFTTGSPVKMTPNEDVAAILPVSPAHGVLAVADGLGGHAGGEQRWHDHAGRA